ncbi:MAG: hypothetical protein HY681_11515, partial [Chloroflexi bacterium]|nr:hypothetical protein [Chloroflexota bacterium]
MSFVIWRKPGLMLGVLSALGLLAAAACGAQEAPTPTPTTPAPIATNTPRPATPTPTTPSGGPTTVVATPTPVPTATPTPVPTVKPKRGGILRQSGSEDPPSFDSHTATSGAHIPHNGKLYSQLLWNPRGDEIVPDAAESYTISADGKTWTFKLR